MTTLIQAVMPIAPCPCCGAALDVRAMPDQPLTVFATCWNEPCDLYSATLPLGEHERLTERQIAGYARVNAQLRQRRATFAARDAIQAGLAP